MQGAYDPLIPYFSRMQVQQLVLEYATERAGSVEVLRDLPAETEIGLGVCNPRSAEIESVDSIVRKVKTSPVPSSRADLPQPGLRLRHLCRASSEYSRRSSRETAGDPSGRRGLTGGVYLRHQGDSHRAQAGGFLPRRGPQRDRRRHGLYGTLCYSPVSPKPSHAEDGMALTSPTRVEPYTLPETMRSAVLFGPRDIRVIDRPVPQPGPGEVLVQVAMCGTCGSDPKSTTALSAHPPLWCLYARARVDWDCGGPGGDRR